MKYLIFTIALLGVPPLTFLLHLNQRWLKYMFWLMVMAMCLYISTSINFFSNETYRGSARGMEVSFIHLLSIAVLGELLEAFAEAKMTRTDLAAALGGGVIGDLTGFAAGCYLRGIRFVQIPTTLLAAVDASVGGKTAVNLDGIKNIVGAFHQPCGVLIDTDTLETLSSRQRAAGLAEISKSRLIADAELFEYIEANLEQGLDMAKVIEAALRVKKYVVEEDERESGLRRILNFGHTIGHGIESVTGMLHGECVAAGMVPMCADEVRARLVPVLESAGLPVQAECDPEAVLEAVTHDKKAADGVIKTVYVPEPGKAEIVEVEPAELRSKINSICHI